MQPFDFLIPILIIASSYLVLLVFCVPSLAKNGVSVVRGAY